MSLRTMSYRRGVGVSASAKLRRQDLRALCLLSLLAACAGSPAPASSLAKRPVTPEATPRAGREQEQDAAVPAQPQQAGATPGAAPSHEARSPRTVGVRGITGSLTAFEVEQVMSARGAALLACAKQRPRSLGHVAGEIAFHVDVDGQGKVERVLVVQSDLGYSPLEACLVAVVAASPFPAPAGAERAEAQWRMSVDALRRSAEPIDSALLEETITRQSEATYEACKIGKGRRFTVNGYLGRGKLHPVSVRVPWRGPARTPEDSAEQLTCLEQTLEQWTGWPKARGNSKVSFELRWAKAPPPPRGRGRARRLSNLRSRAEPRASTERP